MKYEKYDDFIASPDKLEYRFVSEGPRMALTINIEELAQDFDIYGVLKGKILFPEKHKLANEVVSKLTVN